LRKILIFGNSGSGKSTLARKFHTDSGLAHLDLDLLAWKPTTPPERKPLHVSVQEIDRFIQAHENWVIEGCYADLLEIALAKSNEIIFMNLSVEACIANAKNRPWEPHKYVSKQAQDANLEMLIDWISQYPERTDTFSESAHIALYEKYQGKKSIFTRNKRTHKQVQNGG